MLFLLVLGLILALGVVAFIFQNTGTVTVYFLAWKIQGSLALFLLLTFIFGLISSFLVAIPLKLKRKKKILPPDKPEEEFE